MKDWTLQLDTYMFDEIEVGELVECETCRREISEDNARAVLESTYVCTPDLYPECLWEYNNRNYVRSEFYD